MNRNNMKIVYIVTSLIVGIVLIIFPLLFLGNVWQVNSNDQRNNQFHVSSFTIDFSDVKVLTLKDITVFDDSIYVAFVIMNKSLEERAYPELIIYNVNNRTVVFKDYYTPPVRERDSIFLNNYFLYVKYYQTNGTVLKMYDIDSGNVDSVLIYEGKKYVLRFMEYREGCVLLPVEKGVWIDKIYYIHIEEGELVLDEIPFKYAGGMLFTGFANKPVFIDVINVGGKIDIRIGNKTLQLDAEEIPYINIIENKYLVILRYKSGDVRRNWILNVIDIDQGIVSKEILLEHDFVAVSGQFSDFLMLYAGDSDLNDSKVYSNISIYRFNVEDGTLDRLLEYSYGSEKYMVWWSYSYGDKLLIYGRYATNSYSDERSTIRLYKDAILIDELPASDGLPVKYRVYDSGDRVILTIVYLDLINGYGRIVIYDINLRN